MASPTYRSTPAGMGKDVQMPFEKVLEKTQEALKKEGFGVLTRIDVKATMKEKLGVDFSPFVILGACNPLLAHKALTLEPEIGLMLPCNVVVRDLGAGKVRVEAVNAEAMASLFPGAKLEEVSKEVNERLARVIESI
jgi:uncharacterized protein (DUF302 family)